MLYKKLLILCCLILLNNCTATTTTKNKNLNSLENPFINKGFSLIYNDKLYFNGYATATGYELYSYDGTNMTLAKDISTGTYTSGSNSYPNRCNQSPYASRGCY